MISKCTNSQMQIEQVERVEDHWQEVADVYVAQTLPSREDGVCLGRHHVFVHVLQLRKVVQNVLVGRIHRSEGCCPRRRGKALDLLVSLSRQDPSCSEKGHLPKQQRVRNGE
jgi:hypothetical protein